MKGYRRNESSAREGIDTGRRRGPLRHAIPDVEMSHQPERALTLFRLSAFRIYHRNRRNEPSAREGIKYMII